MAKHITNRSPRAFDQCTELAFAAMVRLASIDQINEGTTAC